MRRTDVRDTRERPTAGVRNSKVTGPEG